MEGSYFELLDRQRERYRAQLLPAARLTGDGVDHLADGEPRTLPWSAVQGAFAAEVGEPEGVRTIVFDLLVGEEDGALHVRRFDAEPGDEARAAARQLDRALGPERSAPSIKAVASDGIASRWYPDIASYEIDALRELEP